MIITPLSKMQVGYLFRTSNWQVAVSPYSDNHCDDLNRYDPIDSYLNVWPIVSGSIRRCDLVKGSVLLWSQALRSPICSGRTQFLLPEDENVKFSAPSPAQCLPACHPP